MVTTRRGLYRTPMTIVDLFSDLNGKLGDIGQLAYARDTAKYYLFNGAWVPLGSGVGSSIRPNSIHNPPATAGTYDDEFESTTLDASWTRSVSGTTVVTGTVDPLATVTPDCIQDLHGTWPSWLLLQSDESAVQQVIYTKSWTSTTDATLIVGCLFPVFSGTITTGDGSILIRLSNSGDANEWIECGFESVGGTGRKLHLQVNNDGALTTNRSANTLGGYAGLEASCFVLYKVGDVYDTIALGDYGGYLTESLTVTKTGVTTFDQLQLIFQTDSRTPSSIMGVDYIRSYATKTFALKNP